MVAAARERFATQGFVATTVPQIAKRAGVAVPTVYWAFGSKRALVKAIRDAWLAEARTGERLARVLAIDEASARMDAAAAFMANQWLTGADVVAIQLDAMRSDAAIAADVRGVLAERALRLRAIVEPLEGLFRAGVTMSQAGDIFLALTAFEVYRDLIGRGWTTDAYTQWLARTLRESLLARP